MCPPATYPNSLSGMRLASDQVRLVAYAATILLQMRGDIVEPQVLRARGDITPDWTPRYTAACSAPES